MNNQVVNHCIWNIHNNDSKDFLLSPPLLVHKPKGVVYTFPKSTLLHTGTK